MATQPKEIEEEIAEEEVIVTPENGGDGGTTFELEEGEQGGDADVILTVQIGDEVPEEQEEAPQWVKDLRRKSREDARRIKELEESLAAREQKPDALGPKPTLESCDYDEAAFETQLDAWKEAKRQADERENAAKDEAAKAQERWDAKYAAFNESKKALKVPDFDDAEDYVRSTLSVIQQGILIQGAKEPALLGYALYKNPKKAAELAALTDPIEFAMALKETELNLKVGTRNNPPPPERDVKGPTGARVDNTLDRLRAEADKTGDYSKVVAYKARKREAAAK